MKVPTIHAAQMAAMKQAGFYLRDIVSKFNGMYSRVKNRHKVNKGRKKVLSSRDEKSILRANTLRKRLRPSPPVVLLWRLEFLAE